MTDMMSDVGGAHRDEPGHMQGSNKAGMERMGPVDHAYPSDAGASGLGGTNHDHMTEPHPHPTESGAQEWMPNHPKTGDWYSLKGDALDAYEHPTLHAETGENLRGQDPSMAPSWDESILSTGTTSDSGMYSSDIENHG